jgi:hypothetical protein
MKYEKPILGVYSACSTIQSCMDKLRPIIVDHSGSKGTCAAYEADE